MSGQLRQSLKHPGGAVSEVKPYPGFAEKPGVPTTEKGLAGCAVFTSDGSIKQPNVPGAITAPLRETITRRETDIPRNRMPPLPAYDVLFRPGESALNSVKNPGLQPGESAPISSNP